MMVFEGTDAKVPFERGMVRLRDGQEIPVVHAIPAGKVGLSLTTADGAVLLVPWNNIAAVRMEPAEDTDE